jgi:arginyl-tRNA synthetase
MNAWAKIKENIAANLSKILNKEITAGDLVLPPNQELGDLGWPIFPLAKELGKNPAELAREIAEKYPADEIIKAQAAGAYLNFILDKKYLVENVLAEIAEQKEEYGKTDPLQLPLAKGESAKIVLEFSNGNTHKELHIGHLRNICYGDAIVKILNASGMETIPVSYINDFGIHVAKTLWDLSAYAKENLAGKNIEDLPEAERGYLLGKIYVDASGKEKADPALTEQIGGWKQKIENRSGEEYALWQKTRLWSIAHFAAVYKDLKIEFQDTLYESELVDEGKKIVAELLIKGILKESEGAIIADLRDFGLEVLVIVRSNGTATYSVADLALARAKHERYAPDKSIVVVDVRQELYFKQLFKILELSGFTEKFLHLGYDFVKLPTGMMSSRTGNVITYQDLKEEILAKCVAETKKRHEDWAEEKIKTNAMKIGLGAMKFEMLKVGARSIITFDIEKSLALEGFTSAYIQYAFARIQSILRKSPLFSENLPPARGGIKGGGRIDFKKLSDPKEIELIKKLALYPEIIETAAKNYDPSEIAKYIYELAQLLNDYYHAVPVLQAEEEIKNARLALLSSVAQVIKNGLELLGIETVEEM